LAISFKLALKSPYHFPAGLLIFAFRPLGGKLKKSSLRAFCTFALNRITRPASNIRHPESGKPVNLSS